MSKVEEAIYLVDNGDAEQGLQQIKDLIKTSSNDEKYMIAEAYFKWGQVEEAKELIEELMFLYPDEGELIIFMAEILIDLDNEEEAISYLEDISVNDPVYVEALLLQADLYQIQGLFEVSEKKLMAAKQKMPDETIIDFALAELYFSQGEYKKAISFYQNVLIENETLAGVNIHARLASSLSSVGEFEEALSFYQTAVNQNEDANTLFGYGFTALQAGYNKTAIETFNRLKELDPDYSSFYLLLAQAYDQEGMLQECYATLEQGLKVDELNKELHYHAGKIAMKQGNKDQVEQHLRQAVAIDPGFVEATITLTKYLIHEERYEDVIECLEAVMKYGEYDPQYEWDLAHAKNHLEQYSDALNHYRHAYTSFKDDIDFLKEYGYFLLEEGDHKEAVRIFKQLLVLDPTNYEIEEILMGME